MNKILTALPVRWTPVKFCVFWFVHFHPHRPIEKAEEEWGGKKNLWLGQWRFTSVEEKWRQLLCCLMMSWTDWPDCHRDYLPEEGSWAQDPVWLSVRLRKQVSDSLMTEPEICLILALLVSRTAVCLRVCAFKVAVVNQSRVHAWLSGLMGEWGGSSQCGSSPKASLTSTTTLLWWWGFYWRHENRNVCRDNADLLSWNFFEKIV